MGYGLRKLNPKRVLGEHKRVPTSGWLRAPSVESAPLLNPGRQIGGVHFDGSVDIDLPGVNIAGNQNTSGNAATATLATTATNATNAANATTITVADSSNASCRVLFTESATGNLGAKTDGGLLYDASGGKLQVTKLGIGMTPVEVLDLKSSSGDVRMRLEAPSGSDAEIKFYNDGAVQYSIGHDDGSDEFRIGYDNVDNTHLAIDKSGHIKMVTKSQSNHTKGLELINSQPGGYGSALTFKSERSDDNTHQPAAQIRTQGNDSWNSAASADSNLIFATSLNETLTDRMTIKHDGSVGVGVTAPATRFHVNGAANSTQVIISGNNNHTRGLAIATAASGGQQDATVIYNAQDTENAAYPEHQWQLGGVEKMTLNSTGLNIGGHTGSVGTHFESHGNGDMVPVLCKMKANDGSTSTVGMWGAPGSTSSDNYIFFGPSTSVSHLTFHPEDRTWAAWTPTFWNITKGNAGVAAHFRRCNGGVDFQIQFSAGSTTSLGTSTPTYLAVDVPVARVSSMSYDHAGVGWIRPVNSTIYNVSAVIFNGTGATSGRSLIVPYVHITSGTYSTTSWSQHAGSIPESYGSGNALVFYMQGWYRCV